MPNISQSQINQLCGWVPRPDEVKRILSQKDKPTFKLAAPHLANYWQQEEIGLFAAVKAVQGEHLKAHKQTIGDCVSHGFGTGVDYLYCVKQSAGLASNWDEKNTCSMTEYIYGASREAGNALGPSDGSTGIWAIDGLKKDGYIPRNGTAYDGQKAKQYAWRGVPKELKDKGRIHVLNDYALLETPDDMANALKAGQPCPVCSGQGFSMTRDSNGICRAQGSWAHCMVVIGLYKVSSKWYFIIQQSWGSNVPDGPTPMGGAAPDCSFGCDWDVMGRMLRERDTFSLNGLAGWEPVPPVDWIM